MNSSDDESDPFLMLLASIPKLTPAQQARRELEFQAFVRNWCKDPWRAEQAAKCGEGWLRACFNSAALAYAAGRDEDEGQPSPDSESPSTE